MEEMAEAHSLDHSFLKIKMRVIKSGINLQIKR